MLILNALARLLALTVGVLDHAHVGDVVGPFFEPFGGVAAREDELGGAVLHVYELEHVLFFDVPLLRGVHDLIEYYDIVIPHKESVPYGL